MQEASNLPRVWVKPVNPEEYPCFDDLKVKPVTRGDLGNQFHTTAMRYFEYDRKPSEPPHKYRLINIKESLDLYTRKHDFGCVIWPMWQFLFAENWREAIDELAKRDLYLFDIWAYCPTGPFEAYEWSEYRVSDEQHAYILEKLGPRFLGYDNGEQDGRFVGGYARLACPAPETRGQAYELFKQYFEQLGNDLQNYLIALCSLTFPHYFARMGNHRILGAETAQALPSIPMWYSFIRGAGKQYGLLWYGNASVFNRWGWKIMDDPTGEDAKSNHYIYGPTAGTTLNLLRRIWYVLVMYGSVMMSFEMGHLTRDGQNLTEIGREQLRLTEWCNKHPDRGELHTPVALMMDELAGWVPPRHLYSQYTYLVWGNMPYEKGDHQIDLMLRELYPGYEDASFYHNERGFLTPTPCGDSFDVVLSDAPRDALSRYDSIVLLGGLDIENGWLERLKHFINGGGGIIACANQLGNDGAGMFDVELGVEKSAHHAFLKDSSWSINEPDFHYRVMSCPDDSSILASTKEGDPLVVSSQVKGGHLMLFASDYFLSDPVIPVEKTTTGIDLPLTSPYTMLEHARAILLPYLRSHTLVEVYGPPIQYLVNVTERTDRLLLTLVNNSPETWQGFLKPKGVEVKRAINWMTDEEVKPGSVIEVPRFDAATIEMILSGPAFEVRT